MSTKDAGNKPVLPVLKGIIKFNLSLFPSVLGKLRGMDQTECSTLHVTEEKDRWAADTDFHYLSFL